MAGGCFILTAATVSTPAAQTISLGASTSRVVPADVYSGINYSGIHTNGFGITIDGNTNEVDLQVTNLPAGVTVYLQQSAIFPASFPVTLNLGMSVAVTNVAAGDYTLSLVASSKDTSVAPVVETFGLHVGNRAFWTAPNSANIAWSVSTNWAPPLPFGSDVAFEDSSFSVGTNNVTANTTIGHLSYLRSLNNTLSRTVLSSGVTLLVTNGFSANSVSADNGGGTSHNYGLVITGSGNLVVSNQTKNFSINAVNSAAASTTFVIDLSGLSTLKAYVNRFGVGDISLISEGTVGSQNFKIALPATTIVASFVDPGGYAAEHITPSIEFYNHDDSSAYQNGQPISGTCSSATFWADSFVIGGGRVNGSANAITATGTTQLRNSNGTSRMTMFGVAVDSGTNTISSGSKFTAALATADILADKLWLGHSRPRQGPNAGSSIFGILKFTGGTVDVNTAMVGYQAYTNDNICSGIITNTGGTLVVNNVMVLGYSSGDFVTNGSFATSGSGALFLSGANAKARLNTVTVGGPANASTNNRIMMFSGANLTLTNTIGAPTAKLNLLGMSASSLTLNINGTGTRIYTANVTNSGACAINVATVTNTGAYPVRIPLVAYDRQTATFTLGTLPAASPSYGGYLTNDASINAFCLILTNGPWQPGPVTWAGNVSSDWDSTTTNWLNGSTPYRYADGIAASFDDTSAAGNVNLTTVLAPAGITVNNSSVAYAFSGTGRLTGAGGLVKQGSGTLTLANSGVNDFSGAITLNGGTLQVGNNDATGSLGSGNLTNNASLLFNRTGSLTVGNAISGSGTLTQSGTSTISLTGANTYTGNTVINAGTLALGGSGAIPGSATITIASAAVLNASGRTDGTLALANGQTLSGHGTVLGSLTANVGSTVSPGPSVGSLTVANAVILQGTTVMKIDKMASANDLLGGATTINYGGTLVVSNLNTALASGESFKLFAAGTYSGAFSSIVPAIPGRGLAWDTSDLTNSGTLKIALGSLTWSGATNGDWDTTTTNWLSSLTPATYIDGAGAQFDDLGLTGSVNLTATFAPASILVDNDALDYSFTGIGGLTGSGGLIKQGTGTLTLANSGVNDFSGGMLVSGGTLQVGAGGASGSLGGGSLVNNATLAFNRTGSLLVTNAISGTGTVAQNGTGTVALTAANTYTGNTTINAGVLALTGSGAISDSATITIASGAALDTSGRTDGTLTLVSAQTLQGNGVVSGDLVANSGSTVAPGSAQSVGVLSVTNDVDLQGMTAMKIDKTAGTNDLLGGASINFGGTLVVTNLSAALADGDTFKLFNADVYSGVFTNIVPKRPGPGLAWDTFDLTGSGTLGVTTEGPITPTAPLKVDLNIAGRAEALDPAFSAWVVLDAPSISTNINGLTITFTKVGPFGSGLTGDWWKQGVDTFGCLMADDGLTVNGGDQGGQIEMRISGLSPGPHTIATYLNTWQDPTATTNSPINISVNGVLTISNLVPTVRVTNTFDATSAFLNVVAAEDEDTVILFQAATNNTANVKNVSIDGFEIDTVDSTLQALNPTPANGDEHVDVDSGSLTLMWQAAASAVSHDLYFGTVSNDVATATHASPLFKGNQTATSYTVSGLNSLLTYYWRVDEVDATNNVTTGDTWEFRKRHLAFPGAEGYGRFARGGRGGIVLEVTNLADSGPGTLRWALSQTLANSGPRTIVFGVSGLIELQSELDITEDNSKITVAGQTAPGKGINIKKWPMGCSGVEDLILRDMRVFPGKYSGATVNGLGFSGVNNSIMDHCSSGWSIDECIPSRSAQNMTIQHVMISEPLNVAGHKNYPPGTAHGYSSSTSGNIGSWHHDLLANAEGRNWSLAGGLDGGGNFAGELDIRCNVVYNWNSRTTDGGAHEVNFVNNYYKKGPVGGINVILTAQYDNFPGTQQYYFDGNVMPGVIQEGNESSGRTATTESGGSLPTTYSSWTNAPFFPSYVTTQSATNSLKIVLSDVGCTQPMADDHDTRQIREALNATNTYFGSVSGLPGLPDSETDVGGWENYPEIHRDANWDSDHDGLPDWWETMRGTNPHSAPGDFSDANADLVGDEYTELDRYLNYMAAPHFDCPPNGTVDVDLSQFTYGFSQTSPILSVSNPTNGTIALLGDGKTARFTAPNGFNSLGGLGAFQFSVVDSQGDTMTNAIAIHILPQPNTAPVLSPVADKTVNVGVTVVVTNTATDADVPAQTLTFSLTAGGPTNATIDTNSGVFIWRPLVTQAGTTNHFAVVVTDNGTPNLGATQSFNVLVNPLTAPVVTASALAAGQIGFSISGEAGPDYAVQGSSNLTDWQTIFITNSPPMPFNWTTNSSTLPQQFYRIKTGPPLP